MFGDKPTRVGIMISIPFSVHWASSRSMPTAQRMNLAMKNVGSSHWYNSGSNLNEKWGMTFLCMCWDWGTRKFTPETFPCDLTVVWGPFVGGGIPNVDTLVGSFQSGNSRRAHAATNFQSWKHLKSAWWTSPFCPLVARTRPHGKEGPAIYLAKSARCVVVFRLLEVFLVVLVRFEMVMPGVHPSICVHVRIPYIHIYAYIQYILVKNQVAPTCDNLRKYSSTNQAIRSCT